MDAAQGEEARARRRCGRRPGENAAPGEKEVGEAQNQEASALEVYADSTQVAPKIKLVNYSPFQYNRLKFRDDWVTQNRLCTGLSTGIGDR